MSRERRERRKLEKATTAMGVELARIRDGRLYEAEGFSSFEDYAAARIALKFPELTPTQVGAFVALSLELAAARERKVGRG